ncbi:MULTISPECIES: hypothetical protein [Acidovorax]|jgi:hypothetical protein|uniref:hypothetical protein n=1 Tax=Acidovorax TaxID=12916 RepID=UPI0025880A0D|nr:hypothetical protein [Acidovorax sp.]
MKTLIASALMLLAPAFVLAQTPSQPAAKQATKAPAKTKTVKAEPPSSRTQLRSATGQVAAGIMAAEAALSPAELAIAERVHVGRIACELGAHVTLKADPASPGHFDVEGKGFKYRMAPVATTTGTVRLEDQKGGAVWLQIANKSMLMDQKRGQRLADECMSPEQSLVAEAIKKNPPPSVLEPLPIAKQ